MEINKVVNNAIIQLKKIGLESVKVEVDKSKKKAFILFKVDDLIKIIDRRVRKSVYKANPNVECFATLEEDVIVIFIKVK